MRTVVIIISVIGVMALGSCNQETDPNPILENEETRDEVFDAIANNHNYMTEFMDDMQGNEHAMQMMGNMKKGGGMQMMMKDSMMMMKMMQSMMKDGKMMGNMMKMMHEKGMMSEDCMESCKQMMGEKGMDMKGMGMMDSKGEMGSKKDDHAEHH